ncbi:MAG: FKBP-type peptidyl-prolyl cis-trans isomerase [Homoserinimonas sp.]
MHKKTAVLAFVSIALVLAGCQHPPEEFSGERSCEPVASGEASDAIQVRGGGEATPVVDFDGSLTAHRIQRTVVEPGGGRMAEAGSLVTFAYAAFNGSTGDPIDTVGYESQYSQVALDGKSLVAGLEKSLLCSSVGSRIAAVVPPMDALGDDGSEQHGISPTDSVVLIIDIVAVAADRAQGEPQTVRDSLPQVDVAATGEPQVTIPTTSPPTTYSTTVLKLGEGEQVAQGATVTVEYRGIEWTSGRTFDSSWHSDDLVRMPTSSFLTGVGDAIVGQPVGSQLLVIIPPAFGYGDEGNRQLGIESDDTMVFVIDILAVVQPPVPATEE